MSLTKPNMRRDLFMLGVMASLLGLTAACSFKTYRYELVEQSHLQIPSQYLHAPLIDGELLVSATDTLLLFLHRKQKALLWIDYHTQTLAYTTELDFLREEDLRSTGGSVWYHLIAQDSIVVSALGAYRDDDSHDSLLFLIDRQGRVMNAYSITHPLIPSQTYPRTDSSVNFWNTQSRVIPGNHTSVLLSFQPYSFSYGDKVFGGGWWPLGAELNLLTGEITFHENQQYPQPQYDSTKLWPSGYGYTTLAFYEADKVMYFIPNQDSVLVYHRATGWESLHLPPAVELDHTPLAPGYTRAPYHKEGAVSYQQTYFDPYRKRLYRFGPFGCDEEGNPQHVLAMYDQQLRLLGMVMVPEALSGSAPIVSPLGLGLVDHTRYGDSGTLTLRIFDLKRSREAIAPPLQARTCGQETIEVSGHGLRQYVEAIGARSAGPQTQQAFVIIPTDNICKACFHFVQSYLFPRRDSLTGSHLQVIWAGKGRTAVHKAVAPHVIGPPFLIDAENAYLKATDKFVNPRFFVLQGDSLIYDEVLGPDRIRMLPMLVDTYAPF